MNGDDTGSPGFPGLPRPAPRAPPFDLRRAARDTFGPDWAAPIAAILGVNPRTAQRWQSGANPIPPWVADYASELNCIMTAISRLRGRVNATKPEHE